MKNLFIKLRFDRLKNIDVQLLFKDITKDLKLIDVTALHLNWAYERLLLQKSTSKSMDFMTRKLPQTKDLRLLQKECDNLITALLLHTKALKRANFIEQRDISSLIHRFVLKFLQNAIHEDIITKEAKVKMMLYALKIDAELNVAFDRLGLRIYVTALVENQKEIGTLSNERRSEKSKIPKGVTSPAKDKVIDEIKIFFKAIEIEELTHPELDYRRLNNCINIILTRYRAQLRNLASRRITANRKEMDKLSEEGEKLKKIIH